MKKKFNDLTIEEFVRVICDVPKRYEISMKSYSKENGCIELDIFMGYYEMLHETFLKLANEGNCIGQKGLDLLKNDFFDYNLEFSLTDIYNYLDNNTKGFEKKRCRILLDDMNYYKSLIIEELEKDGNEYEGQFFFYSKAVILLIEQVGDLIDNSPKIADEVKLTVSDCNKLPKELDNPKAKEVLQRGIKANLLDENYQLLKGVTQGQAYLFALYASQELRIYNQWQVFGVSLWGIKNLGRVKLESTRDEKLDVVRGLFSEKIIRNAMTK